MPSPNQEGRASPEMAKPTDKMAAMKAQIKEMEEKLDSFSHSDSDTIKHKIHTSAKENNPPIGGLPHGPLLVMEPET